MPAKGTLAITARGGGSRWYGRISISVAVAREAKLREGTKVSAKCVDGVIIIQADEQGRIRFPPARGKSDPKHAFEAATTTLGLREARLCQCIAETEVSDGQVRLKVPEECLSNEPPRPRKPRKEAVRQRPSPAAPEGEKGEKLYGTAAAIVTEAARSGKVVRPMTLLQIMERLMDLGAEVRATGPRLFVLNGRSATTADLLDEVNRLSGSTEHDRIALIME